MKAINKISFLIVLILVLFTISSCNKNKIRFEVESDNIIIAVGETYEFKPILQNVTNPNFSFSYSQGGIVKISNRKFTGLKPGVCEVTVSLRDYPKVDSVPIRVEVVENKS